MTKNFRKSEKEKIKRLAKRLGLELYRIRISLGECSEDEAVEILEFLHRTWLRISANRLNVFFKFFSGLIRELLVDVKGDVCEPYLQLLCFADKNKYKEERVALRNFVFMAWININRMDSVPDGIATERIPDDEIGKAIDDLMLPWIRGDASESLKEFLDAWQYNRQLCSRSGIVSRKSLERQTGMER